jgi:hypothetical protein
MSNAKTGSAKALGQQCPYNAKNPKLTICADNIAKQIDNISKEYGGLSTPFDFVGLQENENWQQLKENSAALKDLTTAGGNGFAVSFYDGKKYSKPQIIESKFESGRPVQILIFKENIIFVNLHAPHTAAYKGSTLKKYLEEKLSSILSQKISKIDALKNHRIIIVGDFNDHHSSLFDDDKNKKYFVPFRNAGLLTPVYLASPAPWNPPILKEEMLSCCSTQVPYNKKKLMPSDYIFDSKEKTPANFKSIRLKVPSVYDYNLPTSDHLPIIYKTTEIQ